MSEIDLTEHRTCGRESVYTISFQSPKGNKTIVKSCSYKELERLQSNEEVPAGTLSALPPRRSILSALVPSYRDQRKAGVEEFISSVIRLPPEIAQESTAIAEFIGGEIEAEESGGNHLDFGKLAVNAVEELEQVIEFMNPKARQEPASRIVKPKGQRATKSEMQVVEPKAPEELGKRIVKSKSQPELGGCMCVHSRMNKDCFAFLHKVDLASVHAACVNMRSAVATRWKDIGTTSVQKETTDMTQQALTAAETPANQEDCSKRRLAPPRKRSVLKHSVSKWDSTHDPFAAFVIPSAIATPSALVEPEKRSTVPFRKLPSVGTWLIEHNLPDPLAESSKDLCKEEDCNKLASVSMRVKMLETLNAAKDGKGAIYMPAVEGA